MLLTGLAACGSDRPGDIDPVSNSTDSGASLPVDLATIVPSPTPTPTQGESLPTEAPTTEPQPQPQPQLDPSATVVVLNISGGIAGFCDTLAVKANGEYALQSCRAEERTGSLEQTDLETLQAWINSTAGFQLTFEHNPGGPDSMTTDLMFNGVGATAIDEAQQKVMLDWVNGLFIRLWPQAVEPPSTPTPAEIGPAGLCPEINRPAMVIADFNNPANLIMVDPDQRVECNVALEQSPSGRIMTAAGNIYYPVFDPNTQTMTIWQLAPGGQQTPLAFTTVTMEQFGPFTYVVASDGSKIAWARTAINPDLDPPVYRNDLWVANIDGSDQVALQEQLENTQKRFVQPVRFSADSRELFYASQPDELGFDFSGRYDNIYRVPVTGGEPQLVFACPTGENPICIGDITADGSALAYTQRDAGEVRVIGRDGNLLGAFRPPVTDYVGSAVFSPTGNLAFISAVFSPASDETPPLPNPGYISFVEAPYTGEARILLTNNSVVSLWEWLDENRLAYGSLDQVGNVGTSVVTLDGQTVELSPNYALAVLR